MPRPSDGREKRTRTGLGILNPYGGLWTPEIFETPEKALDFLKEHYPEAKIEEFKLVAAITTTEVYRDCAEPQFVDWPAAHT